MRIPRDFGEEYDQFLDIKEGDYSVKTLVPFEKFKNSCFFNTALQMVIYQDQLSQLVVSLYQKNKGKSVQTSNFISLETWMKFFYFIKRKEGPVPSSGVIREIARVSKGFSPGKQADTCEFLYALLENLKGMEKSFGDSSEVEKLFQITQRVTKHCYLCNKEFIVSNCFWGIPNCAWNQLTLGENIQKTIEDTESENPFCFECKENKVQVIQAAYEMPQCLLVNFIDAKRVIVDGFLNETEAKSKHYKVSGVVVYEGNRKKGHYYILKNVRNGWFTIDNQKIYKTETKNRRLSIKMIILEEK